MNATLPTPEEHGGRIPSSIVQKLKGDDSESWRWLLSVLLPPAREMIRRKFQLGTTDELDAAAALLSAWTSFHRHFLEGQLSDPQNLEALAVHLIRIAHNRWQRKKYADQKMEAEVRNANVGDREGELMPFDPAAPAPGPEEEVIKKELCAYMRAAMDQVMEEEKVAHPLKFEALRIYVADPGRGQEEIARRVGVTQSTVCRWIGNFKQCLKSMLGEVGKE